MSVFGKKKIVEVVTPEKIRLILGEPVERVPGGDSVLILERGTVIGTYPVIRKEPCKDAL